MPKLSAPMQLHLKHSIELVLWLICISGSLTLPLVGGQLLRLRAAIWPISTDMIDQVLSLIWGGSLILLEAAIPISILITSILCLRKWRANGIYFDWCSMGGSPLQLISPVIILAGLCSCFTYYVANHLTPVTITQLGSQAQELVQKRWRTLIPAALQRSQRSASTTTQDLSLKSSWLFKHQDPQAPARFSYLGCDHKESTCLSTWWSETDESAQAVKLHDLNIQSPDAQLTLKTFSLSLPPLQIDRIHKTFGPPNSLQNHQLSIQSIHHRFIYHKRQSMAWYSILFACIGACAALMLNFSQCLVVFGGLILIGFGLLRSLELIARAELLSPIIAAWSPVLILVFISLWSMFKVQEKTPKPI